MAKYKVIALNVTGLNSKVHYAKEILNGDQLGGEARAKDLVAQGFLKALEAPKKVEVKNTPKKSK
mgnify:CR=1 FL=1|tara:strand:- start:809 stop:1003 length:195 start_codon:yes stop_codon:yes gene_type:complete